MSHPTPEQLREDAAQLLATIDPSALKPRDRMAIPVQEMPTQDPDQRVCNMEEVAVGYSREQVILESLRCLQCKNAPVSRDVRYRSTFPSSSRKLQKATSKALSQ